MRGDLYLLNIPLIISYAFSLNAGKIPSEPSSVLKQDDLLKSILRIKKIRNFAKNLWISKHLRTWEFHENFHIRSSYSWISDKGGGRTSLSGIRKITRSPVEQQECNSEFAISVLVAKATPCFTPYSPWVGAGNFLVLMKFTQNIYHPTSQPYKDP